jgi:hypothetical protein
MVFHWPTKAGIIFIDANDGGAGARNPSSDPSPEMPGDPPQSFVDGLTSGFSPDNPNSR